VKPGRCVPFVAGDGAALAVGSGALLVEAAEGVTTSTVVLMIRRQKSATSACAGSCVAKACATIGNQLGLAPASERAMRHGGGIDPDNTWLWLARDGVRGRAGFLFQTRGCSNVGLGAKDLTHGQASHCDYSKGRNDSKEFQSWSSSRSEAKHEVHEPVHFGTIGEEPDDIASMGD
jgi:hypothetical protein